MELSSKHLGKKVKFTIFIKKINDTIIGRTPLQRLFRFYLFFITLGTILLSLPFSLSTGYREIGTGIHGDKWGFIDALFTSSSAFSDTGLTVSSTRDTFSAFGKVVIIALIQLGGFGIATIKLLIWRALRKKSPTLNSKMMLQVERGRADIGNNTKMIFYAAIFILCVQLIGVIIMTLWFYFMPAYEQVNYSTIYRNDSSVVDLSVDDKSRLLPAYGNFGIALWWGYFHSASAINNAGFDIIGAFSIAPYRNDANIFLQLVIMLLFIIGGVGFPVLYDMIEWFRSKRYGTKFSFSLFTKITLITYFSVAAIGLIMSFVSEHVTNSNLNNNALGGLINYPDVAFGNNPSLNKNWSIVFYVFSTRNAGYATISPKIFTPGTKLIQSVLMVIGSSPSSTGGGIRTTTLAIAIISVIKSMRGRREISVFRRTIPAKTVFSSYRAFFISIVLIVFSTLVLCIDWKDKSMQTKTLLIDMIYESSSAFGTTGLSTGVTGNLGWFSLVVLILLMFIGQLGVSTFTTSWNNKIPKHNGYRYVQEDIIIG
jgi:trk system potassium uptake protein TrkH